MSKSIKIKLKGYDHKMVDSSVEEITTQLKSSGTTIVGPVPLPTERNVYTVIRAVHKYKSSREQFELRTHKRLIEIKDADSKVEDVLSRIVIPAGVLVEVKM